MSQLNIKKIRNPKMTKTQFYKLLNEKYDSFNLNKKTLSQFRMFKLVNEAQENLLSSGQIRAKHKYRARLEKYPELKEQYYVYHLLATFNVKWNMIKLDVLVKRYYRNSEIINQIYKEII